LSYRLKEKRMLRLLTRYQRSRALSAFSALPARRSALFSPVTQSRRFCVPGAPMRSRRADAYLITNHFSRRLVFEVPVRYRRSRALPAFPALPALSAFLLISLQTAKSAAIFIGGFIGRHYY
jgi:hypothetical protein